MGEKRPRGYENSVAGAAEPLPTHAVGKLRCPRSTPPPQLREVLRKAKDRSPTPPASCASAAASATHHQPPQPPSRVSSSGRHRRARQVRSPGSTAGLLFLCLLSQGCLQSTGGRRSGYNGVSRQEPPVALEVVLSGSLSSSAVFVLVSPGPCPGSPSNKHNCDASPCLSFPIS